MPGKIKIIEYEKKVLVKVLRHNQRATTLPPNRATFLRNFCEKVESHNYIEAVNMFFELRIGQYIKICGELEEINPDLERIYNTEMRAIWGTQLIDKLESLMSPHWPAEDRANHKNASIAYEHRDLDRMKAAVKWFKDRLVKEKEYVSQKKFTIVLVE